MEGDVARQKPKPRSATGIRFEPGLHKRLTAAAAEHGHSVNWLVNRAVEDYLDRLLPASEVKLTR